MKKVLSLFLSALMLINIFSVVNLSAYANEDFTAAKEITLNSSLSSKNDDKFKFTTEHDGKLTITFSHTMDDYFDYWTLYLYKEDNLGQINLIKEHSVRLNDPDFTFTTIGTDPANFYLKVVAESSIINDVSNIDYSVSNTFVETNGEYETEDNNSFETADVLPLNSEIGGNCYENNLVDYFKIVTEKTGELQIRFSNLGLNNYKYWDLHLYRENDLGTYDLIREEYCGLDKSSLSFSTIGTEPATYYLKIEAQSCEINDEYDPYYLDYIVSNYFYETNNVYETENNDSFETANEIKIGTQMFGFVWDLEDKDYYYLTIDKKGDLKIKLRPTFDGDYLISVYKRNGSDNELVFDKTNLAIEDDQYRNISIPASPGRYYILVEPNSRYIDTYNEKYSLLCDFTPIHEHSIVVDNGLEPTCNESGLTEGSHCSECNLILTPQNTISPTGHSYNILTVSGNCSTYGYTAYTCTKCSYSYVVYDNSLGEHNYSPIDNRCTVCGALSPLYNIQSTQINPVDNSEKTQTSQNTIKSNSSKLTDKITSISSLKSNKKAFTVTVKKVKDISGYQVQYSTDKNFKKNCKTANIKNNKTSATVKKLKSGKKYYVRVRTYKTIKLNGKSTKLYSPWSKTKAVKTK
ncbi:MAG: fibronectin type III domain-containing protein [Eubacterium sp.]